MPDKNLTDTEIKKALEKLYNTSITATATDFEVLNAKGLRRFGFFIKEVIDLINRQQAENKRLELEKADIQRDLQIVLDNSISVKLPHCVICSKGAILTKSLEDYDELIGDISAEAYKDCIEKVKEEIYEALKSNYKARSERIDKHNIGETDEMISYCGGKIDCLRGLEDFLDNLLKELVGEDK